MKSDAEQIAELERLENAVIDWEIELKDAISDI
jgi:hypothetical protein